MTNVEELRELLSQEEVSFLLKKFKEGYGFGALIGQVCNRADELGETNVAKILKLHLQDIMPIYALVEDEQDKAVKMLLSKKQEPVKIVDIASTPVIKI